MQNQTQKVSATSEPRLLDRIRQVLEIDSGNIDCMRAQKPERLPTVFSVFEVRLILDQCAEGSLTRLIWTAPLFPKR